MLSPNTCKHATKKNNRNTGSFQFTLQSSTFCLLFCILYIITMIFTIGSTNLFCKVLKGSVKFTHFIGVKFNVIGRILRDVKLCFSFLRFLCRGHKNNHFLHLYTFSRAFNIFDKNFFFCRNRGINI